MWMGPRTPEQYGEALRLCLEDAQRRLLEHLRLWDSRIQHIDLGDLDVQLWIQDWSDTSCGFGGIGGSAITSAPVLVVRCTLSGAYVVYHAFRFAYLVERPSELFFRHLENKRLVGAAEDHKAYEREWDREGFRLA